MTRRKILLIYIPLFILLCGIGGYFFISSDYFLDKYIKNRLISALQDQINEDYKVIIDNLHGNVLTGVVVDDFSIIDEKNVEPPTLSTKKIILKYNIFGLLRRKFLVTEFEIDSPKVDVVRQSDGQVNLTHLLQKSTQDSETESDSNFTFAISSFKIDGGEINFVDKQENITVSLPKIEVELDGELDEWNHSGSFSIGKGNFTINGTEMLIDRIDDVKFALTTNNGELQPLQLRIGNSFLVVNQFRRNWSNDVWDTQLDITFDASDVQNFLDGKTQLAGLGKIVLDINGTDSILQGKLTVTSEALTIQHNIGTSTDNSESKSRRIEITDLAINTILDIDDEPNVTLEKLSLQIAGGTLFGNGKVTLDSSIKGNLLDRLQEYVKRNISYDGNIQISDIKLRSLLAMFLELPKEVPQVESGSLNGLAQIDGNTEGLFHLESNVDLSETRLLVSGKTEPILLNASSLKCEITSEKNNASKISANGVFDNAVFILDGSLEEMDLKIDNIDFGKICKIGNTIPFVGIGSVSTKINNDGTATGYVEIPETSYGNFMPPISLGKLTGNFRYFEETVYIENAKLVKEGETGKTKVSITGDVKLEDKLSANFNVIAEQLFLDSDYNKLFFQQELPIKGKIKGELHLYGSLIDNLDGKGLFTIESGNAWNINIDPVTMSLDIDDYALTIPNFEIITRNQRVYFNAHVTNEGEFNFNLKNQNGNPIQLAEIALAAEIADFPLDGKLDINVDSYQKLNEDLVFEIGFDFSDLTFDGNPLGDATLFATLIVGNKELDEPDYFNFTGEAFEGTGSIEGRIINIIDNPYQFTLKSEGMAAAPILRIFDERFEAITGTADGIVKVEGTLTDLNTIPEDPIDKRIHPYDVDIAINNTQLQYNSVNFTNPKPILMLLKDDILTIVDSSLTVVGEKSSFVNLTGSFDLKNEKIDISANSDDNIVLEHFGKAFDIPVSGSGFYQLICNGTINNPLVELKWGIPSLVVDTEFGNITSSNIGGEITYQDHILTIKPMLLEVMENSIQVGGTISVNQNEFNHSLLNIDISCDNLDLVGYSDFVKNSLSDKVLNQLILEDTPFLQGVLDVSANLNGRINETKINLDLHTIENQPVTLGVFKKPISLNRLHAVTTVSEKAIHIRDLDTFGQIGQGNFQINGETTIPTNNRDETIYDINVSVQKLEVGDFVRLVHPDESIVSGILGGSVTIAGRGFNSELISATCKIDELNLFSKDFHISNNSLIDFKLENNSITSHLPIQISSPIIETTVDTRIDGTLTSPNIMVQQQGILKRQWSETELPLQLNGNIEYTDKQITLEVKLTDSDTDNDVSLNGIIPFDLTISDKNLTDRFRDTPINITLIGNELPLTFFHVLDNVISDVDGVSDINLDLQGVYPNLHLRGDIYVQASHLLLKGFPHSIENMNIQLHAGKHYDGNDVIELKKFRFDLESGEVSLQHDKHSILLLEGITPKRLELNGLTLNEYPIGSFLEHSISTEMLQDFEGKVTATLEKLSIPFDMFFENGDRMPVPIVRDMITFDALSQHAYVDLRVDDFSLDVSVLGQPFSFINPSPIPLILDKGEFTLSELKLQNILTESSSETQVPLVFSSFGKWNMQGGMLINLKLSNFDLSVLDPLFIDANLDKYSLKGSISTGINITGTYAEPDISVRFDGQNITLNQAIIDLFSGTIKYSSKNKQWLIDESSPALLRSGRNQFSCSGYIPFVISFTNLQANPMNTPMEVNFTLKMDEFGLLSDIEPIISSAKGTGVITATVYGTPDSPKLTGDGDFNSVSFKIDGSPISIENTDAQFVFSESNLQIESILGELNDGIFFISGNLDSDWFSVSYMDVSLSMDNFSLVEPGQYKATLSTGADNLRLYGNIEESVKSNLRLSGDVIVHSGDYEQNWENVQDWFSGATVSQVELAFGNTIFNNLLLDVGIEIPNEINFLSSLGGSTVIKINGSGRLIGLIQEPIYVGDINILEGRISTVTQVFDIVEGSNIRNQNTSVFNPDINIILELPNPIRGVILEDGSTTDVMVRLTITGTLDNNKPTYIPELLNSSTSVTLTEADVLALLLPGNSISRSIGGITITVSSGFDPEERHIIAEYPLPNNMSIKVEGDEKGDFGVDIKLLERRF